MSRSGRGDGNLFDGTEPEDAAPGLEELIRGSGRPRRPRRSRAPRPIGAFRYTAHTRGRPAVRRGVLVLRLVFAGGLLVLGLVMAVVGATETATGYSRAGTLASAPPCPAAVDPTSTTEDCVADVALLTNEDVWDDGGEEATMLYLPPLSDYNYFFPSFPGDAAFFDAVNNPLDAGTRPGTVTVRAEFWQGNIVELTAGSGAHTATVTTDSNPGNQAGTALGAALMGLAFIEFGLLLFYAVRAVRLRWLPPGLKRRLWVTGLFITGLGLFIASICLINQPARVGLIVSVAPMVTLVLLLAVWAAQTSSWFRPGRGLGIPAQRAYRRR